MRIGIDATCWSNPRGYGRFTKDMLTALLQMDLKNEYVFFMDSYTAENANFPPNAELKIIHLNESPTQAASSSGNRSIKDMLKLGASVSRESLDVFFYPSVYTYFPILSSAKKIVAIHDIIAEKYPKMIFSSWKNKLFWNLKTWLAIRQSNIVLTVSEFSKEGISDHFRLDKERIRVISEGADESFYPVKNSESIKERIAKYGLTEFTRYILYVGGIAPHKNLKCLVNAFLTLNKTENYNDVKLVLVGDYKNDVFLMDEQLKEIMNIPEMVKNIIFTGYISDDDLNYLYNAAEIFVLPSFCEGFGLPALEAMSCGTVVIGSSTTSIPEVVGDAGLFFDPNNEQELMQKMRTVLDNRDLRLMLEDRSIERASTYSWERSATEMLQILGDTIISDR